MLLIVLDLHWMLANLTVCFKGRLLVFAVLTNRHPCCGRHVEVVLGSELLNCVIIQPGITSEITQSASDSLRSGGC